MLLAAFAFAARRVFGDAIALGALAFLAIDPTVAAHMPVVMTDLPVALLASSAVLCAIAALRTWRALDLAIPSAALGLALGAKHNAILAAIVVAILGLFALRKNWKRPGHVAFVLVGAIVLLWALYGFRHYETAPGRQTFNSTLATTITPRAYPMYVTLANVRARLSRREDAIQAFLAARRHAPAGDPLVAEIDRQIVRLRNEPPQNVPELTSPWSE